MTTERKLKGINFRGLIGALGRRPGIDVARVLAKVTGPAGDPLRAGEVVSGGWYPAAWYDALLGAVEAELPNEPGVLRELARDAVVHDFATLFKLLSIVISPEMALRNATRVMSRYVDGGRVDVVEAREGYVHYRFEEFQGYTRRMWEDWLGGMEAVLDCTKVDRLGTRVVSGGRDGDHRIEVVLRYAPRR